MPEMEGRVRVLEQSVRELDDTISALIQSVPAVRNSTETETMSGPVSGLKDKVWQCLGCSARLGIYNEDRCELRVRYKDFLIYIVPGAGGMTSIPCRRCGHMNRICDDGTGAEEAAE